MPAGVVEYGRREEDQAQITALDQPRLLNLGDALLDIDSLDKLRSWLTTHAHADDSAE